MKKLLKSASLITAGAAITTVAFAAEGGSKVYTLTAGLRGFYDDNIFTRNKATSPVGGVEDAFGFEITPGIRFNIPLEQTTISLGYTYGLRYFQDRPGKDFDQFHLADLNINHRFSERYQVNIFDSFSAAQEPEQVSPVGAGTSPINQVFRAEGTNIRNTAGIDFTAVLTPLWSTVIGYRNGYFDYSYEQFANVLNRMEHLPSIGIRYQATAKTVTSLNYQYGAINYDEASYRDNTSHYVFAGVDHSFSQRLVGALRAGAQFVEWDNALPGTRNDAVNPYIDANLTYAYTEGGTVQLGVRHGRNATDLDDVQNLTGSVLDQQSTLVYGTIKHQITGKLRGALIGQYQNSEFIGVTKNNAFDGSGEDYISIGVTFNYQLNAYLSAEAAYYYDRLSSDVALREYDRNRVFIGFRATY